MKKTVLNAFILLSFVGTTFPAAAFGQGWMKRACIAFAGKLAGYRVPAPVNQIAHDGHMLKLAKQEPGNTRYQQALKEYEDALQKTSIEKPAPIEVEKTESPKDPAEANYQQAIKDYGKILEEGPVTKGLGLASLAAGGLWAYSTFFKDLPASDARTMMMAAASVLPALYLADFVSGVAHKLLDSFTSENNSIWGKMTRRFRIHHEAPNQMASAKYLSSLGETGPLMVLPMCVGAACAASGILNPAFSVGAWFFSMAALHATATHANAHKVPDAADPNLRPHKIWQVLQKVGLSVDRHTHNSHHKASFDEYYALVNGWSNALTERTGLYKKMDLLFWKATGKMPHNWVQDPRSIPKEVVEKLQKDFESFPHEIWAYTEQFRPAKWIPEGLREPMEKARAKWRREFISERRQMFLAEPKREIAEKTWLLEQEVYPWIYGKEAIPLGAKVDPRTLTDSQREKLIEVASNGNEAAPPPAK